MKEKKIEKYYSQDIIDVVDISSGLIFCADGSVTKILEVLPINYNEKTDEIRDEIATLFGFNFKMFTKRCHIKIMNSKTNLDSFVEKLIENCKKEKNPLLLQRLNDYIIHTRMLQSENTIRKRFFISFSYEGNSTGKKSNKLEDIFDEMMMMQTQIAHAFACHGNVVLNADMDDEYEAEILYSFYNPKSFMSEGFKRREESVANAKNYLYRKRHIDKVPPMADYIAPRGFTMEKWDMVLMDGVYHTYLALKDNSYPQRTYAGWLENLLLFDPECDIDIITEMQPHDMSIMYIDKTSNIRHGLAINASGDQKKQTDELQKANNADYIVDALKKNDEDLYQVYIQVTLRGNSKKELRNKKTMFLKKAGSASYHFQECFSNTPEFFKMAVPLTYKSSSVFSENKRNMTNSGLASLYCFSSYEVFDPNGFCLGRAVKNNTLMAVNIFDPQFPNPHIFISGTTGAGKTFTECMIASRLRTQGVRMMFILPLKGHEYKDMIDSFGGSFISLRPGSQHCINIMEIRPQRYAKTNTEEPNKSLLTQKINQILIFLSLLSGGDLPEDVYAELNVVITEIYKKYGITEDNDSIWDDQRTSRLKRMPILQDLYDATEYNPLFVRIHSILNTWVNGSCKNMNGQTNVDLNNKMVAFDVNENFIGEKLLPAFMFLAFDISTDICKQDLNEYCAIVLDEIWKLMATTACSKQIFETMKIIRAYRCSIISATQEISDCFMNEYGRSILTLSETKIFLTMKPNELKMISEMVELSEMNKKEIVAMRKGTGFYCFRDERIKVMMEASMLERELYTPQPEEKAILREERIRIHNNWKEKGWIAS